MCTHPGWFIYQLEVRIWFWSSFAWPPTLLFLSFSTLYSINSLWRTGTIIFSKLNNPLSLLSPPSNGLEINRPPRALTERGLCYVMLPWKQNFWMTTNQKSHLKVYLHYFKLHRSYSISFNLADLGEIFFGTVSIVF